jgi:hypothetical protein
VNSSEKIILASCILLAIFLSTNLMLLPLLRGRRKRNDANPWKAATNLMRPVRSKDAESMEELSKQVEQFKGQKAAEEEEKT